MIEAAEQCGGLYVPVLKPPLKLHEVLRSWQGRALVFCNEMRDSPPITKAVSSLAAGTPVSVLIGPEGGFSPDEIAAIKAVDGALPVSLGPRILRADTAAVAALTVVQAQSGDW